MSLQAPKSSSATASVSSEIQQSNNRLAPTLDFQKYLQKSFDLNNTNNDDIVGDEKEQYVPEPEYTYCWGICFLSPTTIAMHFYPNIIRIRDIITGKTIQTIESKQNVQNKMPVVANGLATKFAFARGGDVIVMRNSFGMLDCNRKNNSNHTTTATATATASSNQQEKEHRFWGDVNLKIQSVGFYPNQRMMRKKFGRCYSRNFTCDDDDDDNENDSSSFEVEHFINRHEKFAFCGVHSFLQTEQPKCFVYHCSSDNSGNNNNNNNSINSIDSRTNSTTRSPNFIVALTTPNTSETFMTVAWNPTTTITTTTFSSSSNSNSSSSSHLLGTQIALASSTNHVYIYDISEFLENKSSKNEKEKICSLPTFSLDVSAHTTTTGYHSIFAMKWIKEEIIIVALGAEIFLLEPQSSSIIMKQKFFVDRTSHNIYDIDVDITTRFLVAATHSSALKFFNLSFGENFGKEIGNGFHRRSLPALFGKDEEGNLTRRIGDSYGEGNNSCECVFEPSCNRFLCVGGERAISKFSIDLIDYEGIHDVPMVCVLNNPFTELVWSSKIKVFLIRELCSASIRKCLEVFNVMALTTRFLPVF